MATIKQLDANRQNAQRSTGPTTEAGVLACKNNALRHGLRALQTVVPGESAAEWETHLAAVVTDLAPHGAIEYSFAEQIAVKLWRLNRVVRYESDVISNAQTLDEVRRTHERAHRPSERERPEPTDIPTRSDVASAKLEVALAKNELAILEAVLRTLEGLAGLRDEDVIEGWSIFEVLEKDLGLDKSESGSIFKDYNETFVARHVRLMLQMGGGVEAMAESLAEHWRGISIPNHRAQLEQERKTHARILSRYKSALKRRRRANALPRPDDLDRIQRYEAHLERGLHRALDRFRDLQEARGAIRPHRPSVTLVVVQARQEPPAGADLAPFGIFSLEYANAVQDGP
jgi:hypothetical protein